MRLLKEFTTAVSKKKSTRISTLVVLAVITLSIPFSLLALETRQNLNQNAQTVNTTTLTSPTPTPIFSDLKVQGKKLINTQGQTVVLHGVNRSGAEYMCISNRGFMDGPSDDASIQAIANWHANAIRIPLNEHCWLGLSDVPSQYSGINYQNFIINYVNTINKHNIYVILDLHWSGPNTNNPSTDTINQPMPNTKYSKQFWSGVAKAFKGNNKVIFDIFNEPHLDNGLNTASDWQCWKSGGTCSGVSYQSAGMQSLVSAIRNTGATNVVMVAGLSWANDLSQWTAYKPSDPLNNLAASWHIYPSGTSSDPCNTTTCYNNNVAPVINKFPVITGEVGESPDASVCGVTGTNTVLNWLDSHSTGYLAWTWDTWGTSCGDLSLITDYSGTAKSPNGTNYKSHLQSL